MHGGNRTCYRSGGLARDTVVIKERGDRTCYSRGGLACDTGGGGNRFKRGGGVPATLPPVAGASAGERTA